MLQYTLQMLITIKFLFIFKQISLFFSDSRRRVHRRVQPGVRVPQVVPLNTSALEHHGRAYHPGKHQIKIC